MNGSHVEVVGEQEKVVHRFVSNHDEGFVLTGDRGDVHKVTCSHKLLYDECSSMLMHVLQGRRLKFNTGNFVVFFFVDCSFNILPLCYDI